jgi:RNA polymerase sigma-70 factor (ECF subfamily)
MARMNKSDTTLIRAVLTGNTEAFGPLVERYQESVYALAWSIVRDFASAQDIAQEAFVTAYTRLSELREPACFAGWLRQIAGNTARMWLREDSGRKAAGDVEEMVAPGVGEGGLVEEVARVLASLPEKKRQVAILCHVDGVSRKDAARFLGVPEATLRKRLHDAKRVLQRRIVEAAEKNLEEHLLPRDFANRCICECKRAVDAKRKEIMSMNTEKKTDCGCGCRLPSRGKTKDKGKVEDKSKSKASKAAKSGR